MVQFMLLQNCSDFFSDFPHFQFFINSSENRFRHSFRNIHISDGDELQLAEKGNLLGCRLEKVYRSDFFTHFFSVSTLT